jgi:hypothetical protein
MHEKMTRREMLGKSVVTCLGASFVLGGSEEAALAAAIDAGAAAPPPGPQQRTPLPMGRIGDLQISRLILGGNLIGGWAHSRDLIYVSRLFQAYNTPGKVDETLRLAEANGINTVSVAPQHVPVISAYNRKFGGSLQTICQLMPNRADPEKDVREAFENGATTIYIQGGVGDQLVAAGEFDFIKRVLDLIRDCGCPAGMGGHSIEVVRQCEARGIDPDYYVKTLHPDTYWSAHPEAKRKEFEVDNTRFRDHDRFHDNIFDLFPSQTIATMNAVKKPWIAFKILAAGALPPQPAMQFAFEGGADFAAVGMFDFQVAEDCDAARAVLGGTLARTRAWCG